MSEENNKQEHKQEETRNPNELEDIRGGGAGDKYGKSKDGVKGGDTEKTGVKPPDAMGAGK